MKSAHKLYPPSGELSFAGKMPWPFTLAAGIVHETGLALLHWKVLDRT